MEASDHDAWQTWYDHYGPKLLLCARQWAPTLTDAEDIVQEAFVRFWKHQRHLPGDAMALLVTSVRRAAIDLARQEGRRERREERTAAAEYGDGVTLFQPAVDNDERRQAIEESLVRLPQDQREVLVLKIWGELTFQQIAAELGIPPNTAASRYRYALTALRQQMTVSDCHG